MHGPRVSVNGVLRKTYLVSLIDDASRLVAHSAFCLSETALDVEGVLKQALLRRGVPIKLVVDNGAAYRANTLQGICARLGIHLIFCRPYAPWPRRGPFVALAKASWSVGTAHCATNSSASSTSGTSRIWMPNRAQMPCSVLAR